MAATDPAGTHALAVYSDLRCPWARLAVRRLLAAAERHGIGGELCIDHRWFPLGDDATPEDPEALDRELADVSAREPDAGWITWRDADRPFPTSSRLGAAWVQAAKAGGPAASTALDLALREALFAEGAPIDDEDVLADIAADVPGVDVDRLRSELASGRPDAELDRHVVLADDDEVPASPTIIAFDGRRWTNPEAEVHDEIIEHFLSLKHYD